MTALPFELPEGFSPLVSAGDTITPDFIIAQKDAPKDEMVNILQGLNISRKQAKRVLKKAPGERIVPGDIIAVKKSMFGKVQATITSSISGTILRYERDTGNLVVRTDQDATSLQLISPVAGIVSLCNNKEIVIETKDALLSEGEAVGASNEGVLVILNESFKENGFDNSLYYLNSRASEKIILVHTITRDLVIKGDSIGVKGFLGKSISEEDVSYLKEREVQLPALIISDEFVKQLHAWENKKVMILLPEKAIILREETKI